MSLPTGGYLRDLRLPSKRPSDLDSIKTEDFEAEFRQRMEPVSKGKNRSRICPYLEYFGEITAAKLYSLCKMNQ